MCRLTIAVIHALVETTCRRYPLRVMPPKVLREIQPVRRLGMLLARNFFKIWELRIKPKTTMSRGDANICKFNIAVCHG
tara:strand:+ start:257 stop:493 length:237 start_codon:yes stop_codon:yes gene_type:complete